MSERLGEEFSERIERRVTRAVRVGSVVIGGDAPIPVQSMTATKTQDIEATVAQVNLLVGAGADIVRVAVDSIGDVRALAQIRARTGANLSVDLQENYRLATPVAPHVDKIRYNPGHLYHHERQKPVRDKVAFIADVAFKNDCALRVGINCGSVDPELADKFSDDTISPMVESAIEHCEILDQLGFDQYVVSLKDSDPRKVIEANLRFAKLRPGVPLHLGVTEAGLPPGAILKTRMAFEPLLAKGIGETIRVSLTVPFNEKVQEILVGREIIRDISEGRLSTLHVVDRDKLNLISCPSCSRVENEAFVDLAQKVAEVAAFAKDYEIEIATMGCRVNGPGETDRADIGLWCGPQFVNLKRKQEHLGSYTYDEIIPRMLQELNKIITEKG